MKKKNFDCVKMKHEIQQKLMKQTVGLTLEDRNRRLEKSLAQNPILGPFLKKVSARKKKSSN